MDSCADPQLCGFLLWSFLVDICAFLYQHRDRVDMLVFHSDVQHRFSVTVLAVGISTLKFAREHS